MADYSKVARRMWHDEKYRNLSAPRPNAQTLWVFLLTNPYQATLPGLFSATEATIAEFMGWPLRAFRSCWTEIADAGMAMADWRARLVWIPKAVTYDPPANPNVAKSWGYVLSRLPECALRSSAQQFIEAFLKQFEERLPEEKRKQYLKAFLDGIHNRQTIPLPSPLPTPSPSPQSLTTTKRTGEKITAPVEMRKTGSTEG